MSEHATEPAFTRSANNRASALNVQAARQLADEVFFPAANDIDAMPIMPRERLDLVAELGWYGLSAPDSGVDLTSSRPIVEALAGGCLTTTFVWMQHLGAPPACAYGPQRLRPWVPHLASGTRRATVAFAGLRPDAPLRARLEGDEWMLNGVAPWVTGWGLTDVVHVAARTTDDEVVWLLVDAPSPGMRAEPLQLLAVNASATVTLYFDQVRVAADRQTSRFLWSEWPARDAMGLRTNGSLALGVADRCCRLIGPSRLDEQLSSCRDTLDAAEPESMPAARAAAARFAVTAAAALVTNKGSSSAVIGNHAERLVREATLLLVFGSRPSIKRELFEQLGGGRLPDDWSRSEPQLG